MTIYKSTRQILKYIGQYLCVNITQILLKPIDAFFKQNS